MKEVSTIELTLENCEVISLTREDIGAFRLVGITEDIARIACNFIGNMKRCSDFFIELLPCADRLMSGGFDHDINVFDRLERYSDITFVEIGYADGSSDSIGLSWGDDEQCNEWQHAYRSKNGALYIYVKQDGQLSDYVDIEWINDPDYKGFLEDWYT